VGEHQNEKQFYFVQTALFGNTAQAIENSENGNWKQRMETFKY